MSTKISTADVSTAPAAIPIPAPVGALIGRIASPTRIEKPVFLLNAPLSYSTDVANNPWIEEVPPEQRKLHLGKALCQFLQLYQYRCAVFHLKRSTVLSHGTNPWG